jgi:peptidyl-prolyl cis-trans isomerase B (cyclophilin B)
MRSIRTYALWVMEVALLVLAVLLLVENSNAFFENARHRNFNKQEIQIMEQTTATIETKFGEITLKFFPDVAPNHVKSFIDLANDGFYNGTTFHRVVPGFVIQGGDPNTKSDDRSKHGTGGPGYTLEAEFSNIPHKRGTLSMARAADPNSAGSQFFICVADAAFLDSQYTIFGEVSEGMDVVDEIVAQPRDSRDNPTERVEMKVKIAAPEGKE